MSVRARTIGVFATGATLGWAAAALMFTIVGGMP